MNRKTVRKNEKRSGYEDNGHQKKECNMEFNWNSPGRAYLE